MPGLYMITVPGLRVAADWAVIRERLTKEFAQIDDVLATTLPSTLLIVHRGRPDDGAWLDALSEAVVARRGIRGVEAL